MNRCHHCASGVTGCASPTLPDGGCTYLRTDVVLLGILLLGLTGYFFDWLLMRLQRRIAPWAGKDA